MAKSILICKICFAHLEVFHNILSDYLVKASLLLLKMMMTVCKKHSCIQQGLAFMFGTGTGVNSSQAKVLPAFFFFPTILCFLIIDP